MPYEPARTPGTQPVKAPGTSLVPVEGTGRTGYRPNFQMGGNPPPRFPAPAVINPGGPPVPQPRPSYASGVNMARTLRSPQVQGAGKAVAITDALSRGTQAVTDFQQGDYFSGGYNALRAGAATMAAKGNPVAGAFVAGSLAGDAISAALPQSVRDRIGSGINQGVRAVGKAFGQDWGVDDTALRQMDGRLPPLTPEQQRHRDIVNGPTRRGVVVPPLSQEMQDEGLRNNRTSQQNFWNRLGNMEMPADMEPGRIYRSTDANGRPVFSGRGTETSEQARARLVQAVESGNMEGLSDLEQRQVGLLRDGGTFDSHGNIMTRRTQEALARAAQNPRGDGSGVGGPGQRSAAQEAMDVIQEMRSRGLRVTGTTLRAVMNDITSRQNNDASNATSLRNNEMNNAVALELDERAALRSQEAGRAQAAADEQLADADARKAGDQRVNDFLTRRIVDRDGNPDGRRIAELQRSLTASTNSFLDLLREQGRTEEADRVARQGFGALSDEDLENLMGFADLRDRAREANRRLIQIGDKNVRFVDSNNLLDFMPTGLSDDGKFVMLRNGTRIPVADLAFTTPQNGLFPDWFKQRTTQFQNALPPDIRRQLRP